MPYRIARAALQAFVERQILLIESTPMAPDLIELLQDEADLDADRVRAVWLGAGLATQAGLALLPEPERVVVRARPTRARGLGDPWPARRPPAVLRSRSARSSDTAAARRSVAMRAASRVDSPTGSSVRIGGP